MTALAPPRVAQRGGPLMMLVVLLAAWVALRALWWEDPFAPQEAALASPQPDFVYAPQSQADPYMMAAAPLYPMAAYQGPGAIGPPLPPRILRLIYTPRPVAYALPPGYARAPDLGLPAFPSLPPGAARPEAPAAALAAEQGQAPLLAQSAPEAPAAAPGRWSLDGWAFYRQGSASAPVSQGRVPIYGANQTGAVLQYRLAPTSGHDPRLYLRAYRAVVTGGETEFALGASLRPLPRVPVRLAGEARYTESPFGNQVRPAAYAVTELAPVPLPLRTRLEAYGQAGWVGGRGATAFADGQASVTRDLPVVGRLSRDAVRMSFGAGIWGGAQEDAQRLDVGPTLRFDLKLGRIPARVSVDYRHRVAGDAAPGSGVAATIATGF